MNEQQDDVTFCVTFPPSQETDVFINNAGGISVKQYDEAGYEVVVAFPREMARAIARAILQAVEVAERE